MAVNPVRRVLDFLAKMGLSVRDDPPKVIDVAARTWGESVEGFALSIEQIVQQDRDARASLSVVLRNVSAAGKTLIVPGWLHFYRIEIDAASSPFGRELLRPERQTERLQVTLAAGETVDTQIPVGALFTLTGKGPFRTQVSCTLPSGKALASNLISISV